MGIWNSIPIVDRVVILFLIVAAGIGFWRGIVSQAAGIAGIIAAFLFAGKLSAFLMPVLYDGLGFPSFFAQNATTLVCGLLIYLGFWFLGKTIEKILINKIKLFSKLNRVGGAFLGMAKVFCILFIIFSFMALVPPGAMGSRHSKIYESNFYAFVERYSPMGQRKYREGYDKFENFVKKPKHFEKFKESEPAQELLKIYNLENMFKEKDFIQKIQAGKYKNDKNLETFMRNDDLVSLIEKIEEQEPQVHKN